MQLGAGSLVHPVRRIIRSGVTEDRRPRRHALAKLLWKRGEDPILYPERPEAVTGEGHGDPPLILFHGFAHGLRRMDPAQYLGQPRPAAGGIPEREELVATGQCGGTGQQDVLDIVKLEHGGAHTRASLHLIEHM
jgi:hypothetical protein